MAVWRHGGARQWENEGTEMHSVFLVPKGEEYYCLLVTSTSLLGILVIL